MQANMERAVAAAPAWKLAKKLPGLSLKKMDPVGDKLKDCGIADEEERKEIKELMTLIKASKDDKLTKEQTEKISKMEPIDPHAKKSTDEAAPSASENIRKSYLAMVDKRVKLSVPEGALNMRLFLKFGELKVSQTQEVKPEELVHCCAKIVVEREVKDTVDVQRKQGGNYSHNNRRRPDDRNREKQSATEEGNFKRGVHKQPES